MAFFMGGCSEFWERGPRGAVAVWAGGAVWTRGCCADAAAVCGGRAGCGVRGACRGCGMSRVGAAPVPPQPEASPGSRAGRAFHHTMQNSRAMEAPSQLEQFLAGQQSEGEVVDTQSTFTIAKEEALRKIAEFQLPFENAWVVKVI